MLQQQPVTVHIKPIVVDPATHKRLHVFTMFRVGDQVLSPVLVGPLGKTCQTVRVKRRIQQDDGVGQHLFDGFTLSGGQIVGKHQRGVTAAGFITVDAVTHIHHQWRIGRVGIPIRVSGGQVALAHVINIAVVFRCGYG